MTGAKELLEKNWDWKHSGLDCRVILVRGRHFCGYVRIPAGHLLREVSEEDISRCISVHGGITFYGYLEDAHKDEVWLGFDCAHAGDLRIGETPHDGWHLWTQKEVIAETNRLAEKVNDITLEKLFKAKLEYQPTWFVKELERQRVKQ